MCKKSIILTTILHDRLTLKKTRPTYYYTVNPKIENNKNKAFERKTIATKYTICQNWTAV